MKKTALILAFAAIFAVCNQSEAKAENAAATTAHDVLTVYYFHGQQRCWSCVNVEKLAKQTIEKAFANDKSVRFVVINASDKANAALVEKYEVTWNALIIAKGENSIEITRQAFANVRNQQAFENLIITEVNKRK